MNAYYIHYTPLNDRIKVNLPILLEAGISPKVVSQYSADAFFLEGAISRLQASSKLKLVIAKQVHIIYAHLKSNIEQLSPASLPDDIMLYRALLSSVLNPSTNTIEHTCQHLHCFADQSRSARSSFILVLEDDAFPIIPKLLEHLNTMISELYFDYDSPFFIDLGKGLGLTPNIQSADLKNEVQRVESGRTRCSYAYAISIAACHQLACLAKDPEFYPYLPSDWYLSLLLTYLKIPTFWVSSPLFSQGSETGLVKSNQANRLAFTLMPDYLQ